MSQKDGKFQPKSKKFGGGGRGFGGKRGGGFSKKFEGDRGERRSFGDRSERRSFDDRPREGGFDRKRSFGDRGDSRGGKSFGGKPRFSRDRDGGGERSFGDKKPFRKRSFDDRGERPSGDRGERSFGDKKPFRKRSFDDRGEKSFGDKKPFRKRFDDRGGERSFGDGERKPFRKKSFDDRGERSFGDKKPFEKRGDRGGFGKKPFRKDNDRFEKRPRRFNTDDESFDAPREASFETRQKLKSERPSFGAPSSAFLYGAHAVRAALLNPKRTVQRLLVTETGFENIREAYEEAVAEGLARPQATYVSKEDIDRLLPRDAVHQDVLLDCQPPEEVFLNDVLVSANENATVVVLDQVTDPHNVGAILRSAAAFGAIAVIAQKLHAPEITGTLAKSASGAAEYVPLVREVNLSRALEQLKEAGFFCIGLDERGKQTIAETAPKSGKVALVMGAEGGGLRRLVAENCDALARLPTGGPIASLNVSNAAAIALYEVAGKK